VNDFTSFLSEYPKHFDTTVYPKIEKLLLSDAKRFPKEVSLTLDLVKRGGKRIRSAIYRYCVGKDTTDIHLQVEGLIELFHVALLIHDDIVDHATHRRSEPTFHIALGDPDRAIIWGDTLFALIANAICDVAGESALALYTKVFEKTCRGQMMDLHDRGTGHAVMDITEAYLMKSYGLKTGIYGFYFPIALALLNQKAVWDDNQLKQSCQWAGSIYQIVDDMLLFSDDGKAKSVASDFKQKQVSYPICLIQMHRGQSVFDEALSFDDWIQKMKQVFHVMDGERKVRARIDGLGSELQTPIETSIPQCTSAITEVFDYLKSYASESLA